MAKKAESEVIRFLRIAWNSWPGSWQRYNDQVRRAVEICAEWFHWELGDIDRMLVTFRNRRYGILKSIGHRGLEGLYARAVRAGNGSYCREYERYAGRAPIIADNVNGRSRDRLCVGSTFTWNGEELRVTSFTPDGQAIACSYETVTDAQVCPTCRTCTRSAIAKMKRRYAISADDVKRDRKARRKAAEAKEVSDARLNSNS